MEPRSSGVSSSFLATSYLKKMGKGHMLSSFPLAGDADGRKAPGALTIWAPIRAAVVQA